MSPTIKFALILLIGGAAATIAHTQSGAGFSNEHAVGQYVDDSQTW